MTPLAVCEKRIKRALKLEAQIEALYNEVFSPELWRSKEAMTMARLKLECQRDNLKNELPVNP